MPPWTRRTFPVSKMFPEKKGLKWFVGIALSPPEKAATFKATKKHPCQHSICPLIRAPSKCSTNNKYFAKNPKSMKTLPSPTRIPCASTSHKITWTNSAPATSLVPWCPPNTLRYPRRHVPHTASTWERSPRCPSRCWMLQPYRMTSTWTSSTGATRMCCQWPSANVCTCGLPKAPKWPNYSILAQVIKSPVWLGVCRDHWSLWVRTQERFNSGTLWSSRK